MKKWIILLFVVALLAAENNGNGVGNGNGNGNGKVVTTVNPTQTSLPLTPTVANLQTSSVNVFN